jgi:hypothetical protein
MSKTFWLSSVTSLIDNNLQYRIVNVLRSTISSIHPWIEGKPVGLHPLVTRLIKGIANERPSKPRYTTTWDVSNVTTYLSALGENKTLPLLKITDKEITNAISFSITWTIVCPLGIGYQVFEKATGWCSIYANQTTKALGPDVPGDSNLSTIRTRRNTMSMWLFRNLLNLRADVCKNRPEAVKTKNIENSQKIPKCM